MYGAHEDCDTCQVRRDSICAVLSKEARANLARMSRRKSVAAHTVIFRDGDQADQYFTVTSGIVKLVKTFSRTVTSTSSA